MVFLPFTYFLLLTIVWWKKHQGFDICVFMSALYTITSLFAIIIVLGDMLGEGGILFDRSDLKMDFLPTITYCALITISILPFSLIYGKDLKIIKPSMRFVIISIVAFLAMIALLNLYLVADSTIEILSGDLSTVRSDHYEGLLSPAQVKAETMPLIVRFLYQFNQSTILALPLMFYYICFDHKPWWFIIGLLFISLSAPLAGIQSADRTEVAFYALMFFYCLVFFKPFISKKFIRRMIFAGLPVAIAALAYFIAVSQARFEDREGGAGRSAVQYVGQGYLNFCFFWDKANSDLISAERELPLLHHFLFHVDNSPEQRAIRSGKQGFFISVFPSFVGDLLLDISLIGAIIWVLYYFIIVFLIIKKAHRTEIDIGEMLALFVMAVIPIFGIFYYRYMRYPHTFIILLTLIVYILTKLRYAKLKK